MNHDNKDLYQHDLAGKILCIPQTIGSSSDASLFMIILAKGIAPKAMLFANHIDTLAATGILMGTTGSASAS
jgi:predicted aconitase with swiveling domain